MQILSNSSNLSFYQCVQISYARVCGAFRESSFFAFFYLVIHFLYIGVLNLFPLYTLINALSFFILSKFPVQESSPSLHLSCLSNRSMVCDLSLSFSAVPFLLTFRFIRSVQLSYATVSLSLHLLHPVSHFLGIDQLHMLPPPLKSLPFSS